MGDFDMLQFLWVIAILVFGVTLLAVGYKLGKSISVLNDPVFTRVCPEPPPCQPENAVYILGTGKSFKCEGNLTLYSIQEVHP